MSRDQNKTGRIKADVETVDSKVANCGRMATLSGGSGTREPKHEIPKYEKPDNQSDYHR